MTLMMIDYGIGSGTETLLVRLLNEFMTRVECVVVAPQWRIQHLASKIPTSPRLIFVTSEWGEEGWQWIVARLAGRVNWACLKLEQRRSRGPLRQWMAWLKHQLFQLRVRWIIRKTRGTHFLCHWFLNEPVLRLGIPLGLVVQDLNWHEFPENFAELAKHRKQLDEDLLRWCDEASVIFPISEYTARRIKESFPKFAPKLLTIPHGTNLRTPVKVSPADCKRIPSNTISIYYPGSVYAHKNHLLLLRAVATLLSEGADFRLALTGWLTEKIASTAPVVPAHLEECRQYFAANRNLLQDRVRCCGIVDESEVEALYRQASLVVLPSAYEGFGLPLLESLERRVRVVCSDIPPFLEQVSRYDAAGLVRTFPTNDLPGLVSCLCAALGDIIHSRWLSENIAALDRWTWSDAADAYIHGLTHSRPSKL